MSFSSEIKKELCAAPAAESCCTLAEAYGMALCGNSFAEKDTHLQTDNAVLARRYQTLIEQAAGERAVILPPVQGGVYTYAGFKGGAAARVYTFFGGGQLNTALFERDCCAAAFLRGAFLSSGHITNPERDYHMEWTFSLSGNAACDTEGSAGSNAGSSAGGVGNANTSNSTGAAGAAAGLLENLGYPARLIERGGNICVYFKDSTAIEDLLVLIGAPQGTFKLMDIKILKDVRNNSNRITNCDTANINKTVEAAARQLIAIQRLRENGALPDELLPVAALREQHPEAALSELSAVSGLSKSHISRRLSLIIELSEQI